MTAHTREFLPGVWEGEPIRVTIRSGQLLGFADLQEAIGPGVGGATILSGLGVWFNPWSQKWVEEQSHNYIMTGQADKVLEAAERLATALLKEEDSVLIEFDTDHYFAYKFVTYDQL